RQKQQGSSGSMQANSAALSGQTQAIHRTLPVRCEAVNGGGGGGASSSYRHSNGGGVSASSSYRHSNGYRHEPYPTYFYNEQPQQAGSRSSSYRQPP
ncbi:unnamed protein product, partial [Rotaria magnacalcarata]